jgi:hypothetical protein
VRAATAHSPYIVFIYPLLYPNAGEGSLRGALSETVIYRCGGGTLAMRMLTTEGLCVDRGATSRT